VSYIYLPQQPSEIQAVHQATNIILKHHAVYTLIHFVFKVKLLFNLFLLLLRDSDSDFPQFKLYGQFGFPSDARQNTFKPEEYACIYRQDRCDGKVLGHRPINREIGHLCGTRYCTMEYSVVRVWAT
jgi:hypothetical protein